MSFPNGGNVDPPRAHVLDDDACCVNCGFDGAEWWHWKHNTYEGKASPNARQPSCKDIFNGEC